MPALFCYIVIIPLFTADSTICNFRLILHVLIIVSIVYVAVYVCISSTYIPFLCSIIIKAEGEAKAAELVGEAIQKNPAFIQLRRIEAAKDVAATVAGSQNKVYLNADNLLLNHLGESPSLATGSSVKKSSW